MTLEKFRRRLTLRQVPNTDKFSRLGRSRSVKDCAFFEVVLDAVHVYGCVLRACVHGSELTYGNETSRH